MSTILSAPYDSQLRHSLQPISLTLAVGGKCPCALHESPLTLVLLAVSQSEGVVEDFCANYPITYR